MDNRTIAIIVIALVVGGYGLVALYMAYQAYQKERNTGMGELQGFGGGGDDY